MYELGTSSFTYEIVDVYHHTNDDYSGFKKFVDNDRDMTRLTRGANMYYNTLLPGMTKCFLYHRVKSKMRRQSQQIRV